MNVSFAFDRLAPDASHIYADYVFGAALLCLAAIAAALAGLAWARGARHRAEVWKVKGLRRGLILLVGVAEPVDEEKAAAQAESLAPFVELTIAQHGTQHANRNEGNFVKWKETSRSLSERPFMLATDNGTRVRVEPTGRIDLADRLETLTKVGAERTRAARIIPGERIWVRGDLHVAGASNGPYRGADGESGAPYILRAPRDRPLAISSWPIDKEDRDRVRAQGGSAAVFLVALAICQYFLVGTYHRLLKHGVPTTAVITEMNQYRSAKNPSRRPRLVVCLKWEVGGQSYADHDDVSEAVWSAFSPRQRVPIVYDPNNPADYEIGGMDEIGVTSVQMMLGSIVCLFALIAWIALSASTRPWWRKPRLDEKEQGRL